MRISRLVMIVAVACFAAGSLIEAQGRGHGPAGGGPQIARAGSGGPNVGSGRTGSGNTGNAGATRGDSGKRGGNAGPTPGNAGDRGKNSGGGRGNAGEDRGTPSENRSGSRSNAGSNGRGSADDDLAMSGGGRRRGGSDREHGPSFVAKMNPQLRARLESMLPSGTTLEQAADGFRNQGQFIAALQQSKNHDIPFGDLKAQMTGENPISLGAAMRTLGGATKED